ncbi:MAG TPA: TylF/MycF/NovP-related O-methyltransferase [Candidatus Saccharimonadales bacterium]|nr:TylF/MycF/NovP-related O-methyltransferase [Candidatus Saccharimonadales bacterium]
MTKKVPWASIHSSEAHICGNAANATNELKTISGLLPLAFMPMLNRLANYLGYTPKTNPHQDFSRETLSEIAAVEPFTMTSPERIVSLIGAVEYIERVSIPGDIVECGVWRGGSMMAVAHALLRLQKTRHLYLFDTFEGMPPPTNADINLRGDKASELLKKSDHSAWIWAEAQIDEVRRNMEQTGYPQDKVTYVKGEVEDTIPAQAPPQIALLRLDTDWYESTKHELIHLYPRLSSGGVLLIDDYGHWQGARRAVDEYIEENKLRLLLCRIDYTGRIAVKV